MQRHREAPLILSGKAWYPEIASKSHIKQKERHIVFITKQRHKHPHAHGASDAQQECDVFSLSC